MASLTTAPIDVAKTLSEMERYNLRKKEIENKYSAARAILQKALESQGRNRFVYDDGESSVLVGDRYETNKTTYDAAALRKRIPKDIFRQIATVSINIEALNKLYEAGLISFDVIQECSQTTSTINIKVHRVKRETIEQTGQMG